MKETIIKTSGLSKKFGTRYAVANVDLHIPRGEIYGFLGPNGAGKTTTIRMLLGLAKPTNGTIQIFGKDLKKEKLEVLKRVGSLVEYPSYYGHLTARENLEAIRILLDAPKTRIDEVLSIVRLTREAKRPVKGFSLGMKQRLGIAAALLGNPELLILDEPTNGLDPSGILEIRELIKSMPKEHGITILVSSHLLSEIDLMATQVGIISKGRMIFQDSIETLRRRSSSNIVIKTDEAEEAWKLLLSKGHNAELEQGRLQLSNISDHEISKVIAELVESRFPVYRVQEEKKSLEDIFLELTGGEGGL
ncbi:ABC transporter ATP-binding protein [Mesobacillus foraminis]|uniref:ABC-2 type transport system ATP-binding protein n=1 Tax=Mesobacillus foraminis TaxID=279826 RepID=A0A4R2BHX5_9BACI|nr:ATP-binding cassette domain-containing protein [Mesobacillus foraminis]TCN26651.1 ABC-2 type transport system ATP-binding protein [Mesobacillus foraminis]